EHTQRDAKQARGTLDELLQRHAIDELLEAKAIAVEQPLSLLRGHRHQHAASGRSTSRAPPTAARSNVLTGSALPSCPATCARNACGSKPNFRFRSCSASSALQVRCKRPMKLSMTPVPRVATAR